MSGPNFNKNSGKGRLATDRYDFEDHVGGVNRKHADNQITISSPITGLTANNVHEALEGLNTKLLNFDYFVTIGEGYDIYETGAFNASAPYLHVALNDLFTNVNNPNYARIRDGGVVVIKSGTYKIGTTVDVPPGITIMGEGFGTKIVNATPAFNVAAPLFRIKADIDRFEDKAVVSSVTAEDPALTSKAVRFMNFVIADNYLKPAFLGDTSYRTAQNTALPLVYIERGAGFECSGMTFFGRSGLGVATATTLCAIQTDPLSGSSYSTALKVESCEFDGFNRILRYETLRGTLDHLLFTNNKVRFYGPVTGVPSNENGQTIYTNGCNMTVTDNYIWGSTHLGSTSFVYIAAVTADANNYQGKSKILCANNNFAQEKSSVAQVAMTAVRVNGAIVSAYDKLDIMCYGNHLDTYEGFQVEMNDVTYLNLNSSSSSIGANAVPMLVNGSTVGINSNSGNINIGSAGAVITSGTIAEFQCDTQVNEEFRALGPTSLQSGLSVNVDTITTSQFVSDSHYVLLVDTTSGPVTVTLPLVLFSDRTVVIKDKAGTASINNITIIPNGADSLIDGLPSIVMSNNWMAVTLISNGTAWYII